MRRMGMQVRRLFGACLLALVLAMGGLTVEGVAHVTQAEARVATQVSTKASAKRKKIGKKKAISIALKAAKLKKSQVKGLEVEYDREDGHKVYEVEFRHGRYEYEYDIDVYTGKIIDRDIERAK